MNPFYDLNKKLASIGDEQEQIKQEVAKAAEKSPVRKTLEESLRSDMKALMEGETDKHDALNTSKAKGEMTKELKALGKTDKQIKRKVSNIFKDVKEDGTGGMNFSGSGSLEEKKEKWIQKATKPSTKGDLHKALHVPQGEKIPKGKIEKATHSKNAHLRHMAQFAKNVANEGESCQACQEGMCNEHAQGTDVADKSWIKSAGKKKGPLHNVVKGIKAFVKGEPEPMDEDEEMMKYLKHKASRAVAHPYNGTGHADAYSGGQFEEGVLGTLAGGALGSLLPIPGGTAIGAGLGQAATQGGSSLIEDELAEAVSRKHFQQVADLLRNIPDEAKRKEMALHHASIFKQQNPRFDLRRFAQAADVNLDECAMWEELKGGQKALDKNHDGKLSAQDFAMLRGEKEVDEGFDDIEAWLKQRDAAKGTGRFDSRKTSTGTVYTRKPETFDEPEGDEPAADAPKRGRGRPKAAKPQEKRVTKGAWKHKAAKEGAEEELDEKSVSQAQAHMMAGAAHNPKFAKKVGVSQKVAKEFNKADKGKDISKLPKKVKKTDEAAKPDFLDVDKDGNKKETFKKAVKDKKEKKVAETTTGSVATSTATHPEAAALGVGKGIYDSINFEKMIQESMKLSVECAMDGAMHEHAADGDEEALTVTATGDDVAKLRQALQALGIEGSGDSQVAHDHEGPCSSCGGVPCQCDEIGQEVEVIGLPGEIEFEVDEDALGQMAGAAIGNMVAPGVGSAIGGALGNAVTDEDKELDEADAPVTNNNPDWPTNQEYSDDALQYSGGLNGPKSTGQTTTPIIASQKDRQMSESSTNSFFSLVKAMIVK